MKLLVPLLLAFFILSTAAHSQSFTDSSAIDLANIEDTLSISDRTQVLFDKTGSLSIEDVLQERFSPLTNIKDRRYIPLSMASYTFYLKFKVKNSSGVKKSYYLLPGIRYVKKLLYKTDQLQNAITDDRSAGYLDLVLAPGEETTVLVLLRPLKSGTTCSIVPRLIKDDFLTAYKLLYYDDYKVLKTFGYVLSGALLMMMLFMAANFIHDGKKEFLFNALYSFCMFLLILCFSYILRTTTRFANFYLSYLDFFLMVVGILCYINFVKHFLTTRQNYPTLDKVLRWGQKILFLLLVAYTYLNFFSDLCSLQFFLANSIKFIMLAIGIFFIFLAFRQRDPLLNYLAAGNTAMVVFGGISLFLNIAYNVPTAFYNTGLFYFNLGIVFELIFFLMGLTYKNRRELIDKTKQQEALKMEAEIAVIKAQQEERDRISADMHDDLGSGMTAIRLYSELAKNKLGADPISEIEKISSSANELLNKMNAIIWSMSSSNDSLSNMIAYIRSYASEYFEDTGINCRINIPERLPNFEVPGKIRRNIFLVVKEALNNILKHANATEVFIIVVKETEGLTLHIQDNGVGIDLGKLRPFSNGLINMRQRMKDIDIEFNIENSNGTLITLYKKVPRA